uniref:Uncharacterized protein n=1 Tax=Arion vulgaris TaxID=1028688 RepID=A0A0B6Z6U1_9EUPU
MMLLFLSLQEKMILSNLYQSDSCNTCHSTVISFCQFITQQAVIDNILTDLIVVMFTNTQGITYVRYLFQFMKVSVAENLHSSSGNDFGFPSK